MKKKLLAVCLVVCLLAVAAVGGTLAYFTDNETATNTFTMGKVDITLTETSWEAPDNAYPGIAYDKNPVVKNVGDDPAWVRMDVTLSDAAAFQAAAAAHSINDLKGMFLGLDNTNWTFVKSEADTTKDTLTFSFYYNTLLDKDASTTALFTQVKIPGAFNVEDMKAIGEDFTVTITAHAMQTSDDYTTVEDAFAAYTFEEKA